MGLLIFTMLALLLGGALSIADSEQGRETDETDDCGDEESRDGRANLASAPSKSESIPYFLSEEADLLSQTTNASSGENPGSVDSGSANRATENPQSSAPSSDPDIERAPWSAHAPNKVLGTQSNGYSGERETFYADAKEGESLVVDLPASVSGSVHRVDLRVHYRYEFGSEDRLEVSDVVRKYTVFLAGEEMPGANFDVEIEELYDRSGSVVFSEGSFFGLSPFLIVNFGDARETTFFTQGSLRPDATEPYDQSDYTWIETVEISSLVGDFNVQFNRCVSSVHELVVLYKGTVSDY